MKPLYVRVAMVAGLTSMSVASGCGNLLSKVTGDADASEAGAAAFVDATASADASKRAANEGEVARYPDEVATNGSIATLERATVARTAQPGGVVVATLPKGTAVVQAAKRSAWVLVSFQDPQAPSRSLMGWISRDAFLPLPASDAGLLSDAASAQDAQAARDASTPDASASQAKDAGAETADAGPKPLPAGPDVAPASGGKCTDGYVLIKETGKCHRPCPRGIQDCSAKGFCIRCDKDTQKVCAEKRGQCK